MLPKKVLKKLWPINRSNLLIQDGRHQYVAIHNISLTCNYIIVNNSSIPSFFRHGKCIDAISCVLQGEVHALGQGHFKPAEVGPY